MLQSLITLVGYREAEKAALLGVMFPGNEALKKGLVDKVVPQEEILSESHEEMKRWLKIPGILGKWVPFVRNINNFTVENPSQLI